jgi:hypothetical protein
MVFLCVDDGKGSWQLEWNAKNAVQGVKKCVSDISGTVK